MGTKKNKSESHWDHSPSVPTCHRVTNFQVGARHRQAECLGSNSCLGYSEVTCTAWEIMAGTLPDTPHTHTHTHSALLQEARVWSITPGVIAAADTERPLCAECWVHPGELGRKWLSIRLYGRVRCDSCSWLRARKSVVHMLQWLSGTWHCLSAWLITAIMWQDLRNAKWWLGWSQHRQILLNRVTSPPLRSLVDVFPSP